MRCPSCDMDIIPDSGHRFKVGALVRLKSGSPTMTVTALKWSGGQNNDPAVDVTWFTTGRVVSLEMANEVKSALFKEAALDPAFSS